jgi:hypothetical protein
MDGWKLTVGSMRGYGGPGIRARTDGDLIPDRPPDLRYLHVPYLEYLAGWVEECAG